MTFGSHLQKLREAAGLSQSGLARKAGISVKTIQNWEINRALPRLDAAVQLAAALGVSIEELTADISLVDAPKRPHRKGRKAE